MEKRYELLLFDADGTLYDFEKTEKYALRKTFEYFNLEYFEDVFLPIFKKVNLQIWKEFERNEISAKKLKSERFARFFNEIGLNNTNASEFGNMYLVHLSEENSLLPGARELIEELSKKFRMAIITNGLTLVQRKRLYNSALTRYWDEIIISEEIGYTKPNKEIFEITLNKLNCSDKNKALMIGDKLSSDILGGINSGIDTCWFNPEKKINSSEIKPTYEIVKLYQLKEIVFTKTGK